MIKIFPVGNVLRLDRPPQYSLFQWSPFANKKDIQSLRNQQIIISSLKEADLIISYSLKELWPLMLWYGKRKKFMIWTHEPRYDTHFESLVKYPFLPKLHVLNVYTGLCTKNYMWLPTKVHLKPLNKFEFKHRKVVALMRYINNPKKWSLKYQGKELDLLYLRTQIALEGYSMKMLDVYGVGWPENIRKGESQHGEWPKAKQETLQNYHFNLAFENTKWPYYCTEKIWDSIQGGCLPIYYGESNAIYEDFPQDSFLDYCQFGNAQELFRYIQLMTPQEFIKRMNLCIEAFNIASKNRETTGISPHNLEVTASKIQEIVEQ